MFLRNRCLKLLGIFVLMFFLFSKNAQAEEIKVQTRGYGATYQAAVVNGLQSGVGQVMGLSIDAEEISTFSSTLKHSKTKAGEALDLGVAKTTASSVAIGTAGMVSGYRIMSHRMEQGQHRVDMEVVIERYETPGPKNQRRKLAVYGFTPHAGVFKADDSDIEIESFLRRLNHGVVAEFTQSRRFIMLEREYGGVTDAESVVWSGQSSDIKEKAKLGRRLGADYVVYGSLRELAASTEEKRIALTGEVIQESSGKCVVEYRIMVPATGQIKWAGTVESQAEGNKEERFQELEGRLLETVARKLVHHSLENIYPMRVIKESGTRVLINQGGQTLAIGEELTVYKLGDELTDPYTKESLGHEEISVAQARVVEVKPKYAVAEIFEGDKNAVHVDAIVRRALTQKKNTKTVHHRNGSIKVDQGGGVRLPFD